MSLKYQNRVSVSSATVMRISEVNFTDEGIYFCCQLSYYNTTSNKLDSILKSSKLETVYGEENIHACITKFHYEYCRFFHP